MRDAHSSRFQLGLQPMQRHMRRLANALDNKRPVRLQNALAMASHLARNHRTRRPMPLRPLHNCGNRNTKTGRDRSAALASQNRRNYPLSKINGKRSDHLMLASTPASILNLTRELLGIPPRFNQSMKCSKWADSGFQPQQSRRIGLGHPHNVGLRDAVDGQRFVERQQSVRMERIVGLAEIG